MFFRRERPRNPTFQERLENLKRQGFDVAPAAGGVRVSRSGFGTVLQEVGGQVRQTQRAGVLMGEEIGALVDGGFQKFFQTPGGRRQPANPGDLRGLHEFEEDLKEGLGMESLYNESLGTISTFYVYDRLKDRDRGVRKRIWEA